MQDYSISRCSRKCAVSGRALEPGEPYVSVIVPDGDSVRRLDIARSHWEGPPQEAIGWWSNRMPDAQARRLRPAPVGVLLDALSDLLERPGQEALAYLLALLLVRRRVLVEQDDITADSQPPPTVWHLVCPADGRMWEVPVVAPPAYQMGELQESLKTLLFTEE
ncbi:MAG: hypothetical protein D6753_09930 [Planctomycetota bacterium]|nr:MAG: hypothetical protein D6753_09930 [Planctomycetota bacterium]